MFYTEAHSHDLAPLPELLGKGILSDTQADFVGDSCFLSNTRK